MYLFLKNCFVCYFTIGENEAEIGVNSLYSRKRTRIQTDQSGRLGGTALRDSAVYTPGAF